MATFFVYTDGGARGNPGPAGIGVIIEKKDKEIIRQREISKYIGETTNNQAEYQAVREALEWFKENIQNVSNLEIQFFLDSELIVEQLNQRYKIKNEGLKPLFWEIRQMIMSLGGKVTFEYIPRQQNKEADKLVNKAIDESMGKG